MFHVSVVSDEGLCIPEYLHGSYVYSEVDDLVCDNATVKPLSQLPPLHEDLFEVIVYASKHTLHDVVGYEIDFKPGKLYPIDKNMLQVITVQYFMMYQLVFTAIVRCCHYISLKEDAFQRVKSVVQYPWQFCSTTKSMVCNGWLTAKAKARPTVEAFWPMRLV